MRVDISKIYIGIRNSVKHEYIDNRMSLLDSNHKKWNGMLVFAQIKKKGQNASAEISQCSGRN